MIEPTEGQLREIADYISCGDTCYLDKETSEIVHLLGDMDEMESFLSADDPFRKTIERIKNEPEKYIAFEPMEPREAFQVMADFFDELPQGEVRSQLSEVLQRSGPFRRFKDIIEDSEFRQQWFDFRLQQNLVKIKGQIYGVYS